MGNPIKLALILLLIFSFNVQAFAQGSDGSVPDGSMPPATESTETKPADPVLPVSGGSSGTSTGTATPNITTTPPTSTGGTSVTPAKPKPVTSKPTTILLAPVNIDTTLSTSTETANSGGMQNAIITVLSVVAISVLLFFGLKIKKKEDEKKDDKKCLNIKKLMEDKLNELTDLEGKLKGLLKDEATKELKNAIPEGETKELILFIEQRKKEYEKLKELYEKCIASLALPKTTLLYLYKPEEKQILLALKKRRFGTGKWNGVGGKLEDNESIVESLKREVKEEIGVDIKEENLRQVATIDFIYKDKSEWDNESHVFFAEKWEGEPVETEEMIPKWYSIDALPYDKMWIDDPYWLPKVLEGKKVRGVVNLNKEGNEIIEIKINEEN